MSTQRVPTARDDLGVIMFVLFAVAYLILATTWIAGDTTTPTPRDITGDTAAPAVIYQGPR